MRFRERQEEDAMFLRVDKLQFELPAPEEANPNAAATVQELLGGKFGEMATLMNSMYQSLNFRNKEALLRFDRQHHSRGVGSRRAGLCDDQLAADRPQSGDESNTD